MTSFFLSHSVNALTVNAVTGAFAGFEGMLADLREVR